MFKRRWLALLPILLCAQSGCLWTEQTDRSAWLKRFNQQASSSDYAQIKVALIERPLGDDYINNELWLNTDGFIGDAARRGLLEENGFHIGQLVGAPPHALQQLLLSRESCTISKMTFPPDRAKAIDLGPIRAKTSYKVVLSKSESDVTLEKAGFMLDVVATFTSEATKFTFTPKVENNEAVLPFRARPDQSAWELEIGRASRRYPEMSWDITLATNQYLIIGGRTDRPGTLGLTAFTQEATGVQRLLVIQNCRSSGTADAVEKNLEERIRTEKSTPLALQASRNVQSLKR